jgi:hypothetical protein
MATAETNMTDYQSALDRLDTKVVNTCAGCGRADVVWTTPMIVCLPDVGGGKIKDEGPEALAIACRNCGYLRLFVTEFAPEVAQ